MGNLFTVEYDENIEKSINDALCITNLDKRIEMLREIIIPQNSKYNAIIENCILDAKLKPRW